MHKLGRKGPLSYFTNPTVKAAYEMAHQTRLTRFTLSSYKNTSGPHTNKHQCAWLRVRAHSKTRCHTVQPPSLSWTSPKKIAHSSTKWLPAYHFGSVLHRGNMLYFQEYFSMLGYIPIEDGWSARLLWIKFRKFWWNTAYPETASKSLYLFRLFLFSVFLWFNLAGS